MIEICQYHGSLIDIDQLYGCWSLIDFDPARQHPWCGLDTGIRYTAKHIQAAKRHLNFKAKWSTAVLLQNRFWWEERVKDSELELRWKTIGIYWKDHLSWNMLSHWNMFENHTWGHQTTHQLGKFCWLVLLVWFITPIWLCGVPELDPHSFPFFSAGFPSPSIFGSLPTSQKIHRLH